VDVLSGIGGEVGGGEDWCLAVGMESGAVEVVGVVAGVGVIGGVVVGSESGGGDWLWHGMSRSTCTV